MERVISERGGQPWPFHSKPFLFDILHERGWERYDSILDFVSTPDVLERVAATAASRPASSGDTPPGVRLMESTTKYDPQAEGPFRSSQLRHTTTTPFQPST